MSAGAESPARRLRMAYITSFFPPDRMAGAELGTHFMARHMAGLGHEVHVLITRPNDNRARTEMRDGYTIHWLAYRNLPGLRFFSEAAAAMKVLRDVRPQLVQANCLLPGGWVASRCSRSLGIPSVVLCYGYDVSDMRFPASWFGRQALEGASRLLASTRYCAGVMRPLSARPADAVFYSGVDAAAFPLREPRLGARPFRLLHVGRMIPEKGFELLVRVMSLLPASYSLQVLGDGPLRPVYLDMVQSAGLGDRIQFLGILPNDRLCELHRGADALLLPSLREPFGVACLEAVCSGLPVVCSGVMGLPEAVADGRNGIVVPDRDPQDWCAAVRRACEDDDFRRHVHACAKVDREKWAWTARLAELEEIYASLLAQEC